MVNSKSLSRDKVICCFILSCPDSVIVKYFCPQPTPRTSYWKFPSSPQSVSVTLVISPRVSTTVVSESIYDGPRIAFVQNTIPLLRYSVANNPLFVYYCTYSIYKIVNKQRIVCDRICVSRYKHPGVSATARATLCLHLN